MIGTPSARAAFAYLFAHAMKSVRRLTPWLLALAVSTLVGCSSLNKLSQLGDPDLKVGQDEAAVRAEMGQPTDRFQRPNGGSRLEFAPGPAGRHTWMVDLDANGRVVAFEQVRNATRFAEVRNGQTGDELRYLIGRPSYMQREYMDKVTWYWRYPTYECLIFAVTLSPLGRVAGGGSYLPDPVCDVSI